MIRFTLVISCLALTACGAEKEKAPTGQVVARIAGAEITAAELRLETPSLPDDPVAVREIQQQALEGLISRKILAAYAQSEGMDKTPEAAMVLSRARDLALMQLVRSALSKNVPNVSDDEVAAYVTAHPASFAQRKLLTVDQFILPPVSTSIAKQLAAYQSLQQVKDLLERSGIKYVRSAAIMDTLSLEPEVAATTAGLKEGALLMTPGGDGGFVMSQITAIRAEPLEDAAALQAARFILTNQRSTTQVRNALNTIVKRERAKVMINPAFVTKTGQATTAEPGPAKGDAR
jgi:EpsD family peptidyl-prolyl cis-trans isomerase